MNIVLIGMRGSGKSTIGKILSQKLKTDLIETDSLIEKSEGQKINTIVQKNGWNYFRNVERNVISGLKDKDNVVIATGGGMVLDRKNINILNKNGLLIYLQTSSDELFKLMKKLYENAADMIIDTQSIDLKRFTSDTQLFGVIGNPVSQSLSPLMHNAAFKKLDLNCIFFAIQILNLKKSLQGLKMLGFSGLSVTIPFK